MSNQPAPPPTADLPMPRDGGSYRRLPDGSLERIPEEQPDAVPAAPARARTRPSTQED